MQYKAAWAMAQQDGGFATGVSSVSVQPSKEHIDAAKTNQDMLQRYQKLLLDHTQLCEDHQKVQMAAINNIKKAAGGGGAAGGDGMMKAASLGVVRLDYDYPAAPGDIDSPQSFGYDVFYRVVPGLTFEMCQSGKMTQAVEEQFGEAIDYLVGKGVVGITGDCGFMMYFQKLARQRTTKPVFLSSLAQLPAVTCAFNQHELIAIFTANSETLKPMRNLIKDECGVDPEERRFIIVGCQDVPGFEAVAEGKKVNVQKVTPGMVEKAKKCIADYPKLRALLLECTELPPYADALRASTRLPVYDAITGCDFFISGCKDNERFGIQGWQKKWDGKQDAYTFGANLTEAQQASLVNKIQDMPLRPESMPFGQ